MSELLKCCNFWFEYLENNPYINILDVDKLEDNKKEEQQILRSQQIHSFIAVPLKRDGLIIGFLGIENPIDHNNHIERITILGDYLSVSLTNRDSVSQIMQENKRIKNAHFQLNNRKKALLLAGQTKELYYWIFYMDRREIIPLFDDTHPVGYSISVSNVPESLMDTNHLYGDDRKVFMKCYAALYNDVDYSECTVRVMNYSIGRYEWRHIYYMRLPDDMFNARTAIGYSVSAEREQENEQRYERETQLRNEMIKNAVAYFQVNLSLEVIEEYHSEFINETADHPLYSKKKLGKSFLEENILKHVQNEDRDKVRDSLSNDALLERFALGKNTVSVVFRAEIPKKGLKWIEAKAIIVQRNTSGDIIALIFSYDIDEEKKDQLAIEAIMDEEIESVVIINVDSGMAHFAQIKADKTAQYEHKEFQYEKVYSNIIHNAVVEEDKEECENYFYIDKLKKGLEYEKIISLIYRINHGDGRVRRKNNRAFYLGKR